MSQIAIVLPTGSGYRVTIGGLSLVLTRGGILATVATIDQSDASSDPEIAHGQLTSPVAINQAPN